jgi:mono/diheme cytochrome c family protein
MRKVVGSVWFLLAGAAAAAEPPAVRAVVETYCVSCHDAGTKKGGLNLAAIVDKDVAKDPDVWEKVVRRMRGRQMPPPGKDRPDDTTYKAILSQLEANLDKAAVANPNPGRTETLRRLTRTEYRNAVRDLLHLDVDVSTLLPADSAGHGFDNVTVGDLSPTLLDRYLTAAQKIARLAVGGARPTPGGDTIRVKGDVSQEDHVEGLPLGTRGGALIPYTFPRDGDYDITIGLARDRNEHVEGLTEPNELEILIDKESVKSFTVKPPPGRQDFTKVDAHLTARLPIKAGPHDLGVTFLKSSAPLIETIRQPYTARFNLHRHPRQTPAVYQVTITGPYADHGPGDTPSRRRIFIPRPAAAKNDEAYAAEILTALARRAYRRPVQPADVDRLMALYRTGRQDADFDAGIELALSAILVSREFLFRVETDPPGVAPKTTYSISDIELASRLSFFLWNSLPDDELLGAAARGDLHKPDELSKQTRRMLADPRAESLATNFAGQWLYLRNLENFAPDGRLFPDFDDNLRQAFRRETEMLFNDILLENRSVLGLLKSDATWLNERLAKHYGVPNVYGPRFRKMTVEERGGLLRQGSVLTVTSYATRTSPVLRGKWVLENLLGTPPPEAPPNVPALDDNPISATLPVRERLVQHRANPTCASCHRLIDPPGFALENYDAVGRWRMVEDGRPVDASGGLSDGREFTGVAALEKALLEKPDEFASTLTEKLLTYALGRGIDPADGPAVRGIVRSAKKSDYRFQDLIVAVVQSPPFTMRMSR